MLLFPAQHFSSFSSVFNIPDFKLLQSRFSRERTSDHELKENSYQGGLDLDIWWTKDFQTTFCFWHPNLSSCKLTMSSVPEIFQLFTEGISLILTSTHFIGNQVSFLCFILLNHLNFQSMLHSIYCVLILQMFHSFTDDLVSNFQFCTPGFEKFERTKVVRKFLSWHLTNKPKTKWQK